MAFQAAPTDEYDEDLWERASDVIGQYLRAPQRPIPDGFFADSLDTMTEGKERLNCPDCRRHKAKDHYMHDRTYEHCKYPRKESMIPSCVACMR